MSTTDETARKRPTVAAMRELALERDAERRARVQVERKLADTQSNLDVAIEQRDKAMHHWDAFDAEAKALGAIVAPLSEYVAAIRGQHGGYWPEGDNAAIDREVAEGVERVLALAGQRFGARIIPAQVTA